MSANTSANTKVKQDIFLNRNNTFAIEFRLAGFDFTQVTKVEFELNGKSVNSTDDPAFFDIITGPLTVGSGQFVFIMGFAVFLVTDAGDAIITIFGSGFAAGLQFSGSKAPTEVEIAIFDD